MVEIKSHNYIEECMTEVIMSGGNATWIVEERGWQHPNNFLHFKKRVFMDKEYLSSGQRVVHSRPTIF